MPLQGGTKSALAEGARARESYPRTGASSNFANFPLVRGSGPSDGPSLFHHGSSTSCQATTWPSSDMIGLSSTSSIFTTALPSLLSSSMRPRPKIVGTIRRAQPLLDTQSAKGKRTTGMSCELKLSKKRRRSSPALVKCSYSGPTANPVQSWRCLREQGRWDWRIFPTETPWCGIWTPSIHSNGFQNRRLRWRAF